MPPAAARTACAAASTSAGRSIAAKKSTRHSGRSGCSAATDAASTASASRVRARPGAHTRLAVARPPGSRPARQGGWGCNGTLPRRGLAPAALYEAGSQSPWPWSLSAVGRDEGSPMGAAACLAAQPDHCAGPVASIRVPAMPCARAGERLSRPRARLIVVWTAADRVSFMRELWFRDERKKVCRQRQGSWPRPPTRHGPSSRATPGR